MRGREGKGMEWKGRGWDGNEGRANDIMQAKIVYNKR